MKRGFCAAVVLGAIGLAAVARVSAHHSFAATYFEDQTTKIEGDLVQFQFRNPHSYVHLEAKDDGGVVQRWTIEWGSGMQLSTQGLTATTLKVGDHVVVTGAPGRDPEDHRLRMRSIERPKDGFKWNGTFQ
jgi:Family of unknown function (DUF6152)